MVEGEVGGAPRFGIDENGETAYNRQMNECDAITLTFADATRRFLLLLDLSCGG